MPQHPEQPQDSISFDQSANYLRATGPDIHLTVEEILAGIQDSGGSVSSDDLGVVLSDRAKQLTIPSFVLMACQKIPVDSVLPLTKVKEWKEDIQKAIFPVQPVMGCILIRLWVSLFGEVASAHVQAAVGPISIPTVVSRRVLKPLLWTP